MLGGLIVGIAEELSIHPAGAAVQGGHRLALLLLILLVRPRGPLNGKVL